jgi:hypothetical protein
LFYDSSADINAGIDVIFGLTSGIVQMFEKMAVTHGVRED